MLFLVLTLLSVTGSGQGQLQLPTPRSAYESYDPAFEAVQLASEMARELDPVQRLKALRIFASLQQGQLEAVSSQEIREFLEAVDWERQRARILRLMIYQSGILEAFSRGGEKWPPFVHDFLLFFLDRLPRDRLVDRIVSLLQIPAENQGQRLIALADRAPSLQKIGQIMARHPDIPPGLRRSLQTFENSIRTSRRDDLLDFIKSDLGPETVSRYQMEFDREVLAEASVGAVIKVGLTFPQNDRPETAVCKVLKPHAVAALRDELVILGQLVSFFEINGEFYQLGQTPLSEMFQQARNLLSKEIQVLEEQKNLARASEYYLDDPKVKVPRMYPMSTPNVTFMEFIKGGKIVDFPGGPKARTRLAERLDEVMTWDVIFSRSEEAFFHGDPHAGNVFYMTDDPGRIALLDWGLSGSLPRRQREQLIQMMLGIYLRDKKRVRNNVGVILEGGFQKTTEEKAKIQQIALEVMEDSGVGKKDQFLVLNDIVVRLTKAGYSLNFNLVLFIKAQVTIIGILQELDPELKRAKRAARIVGGQILRETPKRLLNTVYFPGWTSHTIPAWFLTQTFATSSFRRLGEDSRDWASGPGRESAFPSARQRPPARASQIDDGLPAPSVLSRKFAVLIRDGFSSPVRRATQECRESFEERNKAVGEKTPEVAA